jgi:hypothetical protein
VKNAKLMLVIFLTGLISSCQSVEEFPANYYYEIDMKHKVCAKWRIINKKTLNTGWHEDMPLAECDAVIGFKYDEMVKVRRWVEEISR